MGRNQRNVDSVSHICPKNVSCMATFILTAIVITAAGYGARLFNRWLEQLKNRFYTYNY